MRKERRKLTGSFKAKVALEALQEKKTIVQLAAEYNVHANQISSWKKQLQEQSSQVFEKPQEVKDDSVEKLQEELYKQIGQLRVENEWLKKNLHSFLDKNIRKRMISKENKKLTLTRQCELAGVNKSSLYYEKRAESEHNIALMHRMDAIHTAHPYYGGAYRTSCNAMETCITSNAYAG
ncbi:MAG: transposase [Bacteroidetes bacterium]|jgi:putative transposase|nr:transposase [Bacteroidota bacterium]